jgi:CRP/FNR family cyclic AMP-dependent transcriptional regulator
MLDQKNRFDRILYNELFGLLPQPVRAQLFNKAEARLSKPGEFIFKKGEDGPWLAAVMAGRVRISLRTEDGREMLVSMVERGEILGERAVFDGLPRAADAIAEEETSYLVFKRDDLIPVLYNYPEALMNIIKILCGRMLRYMNTMELFALESLPVRLANFLLFLGQKYGQKIDGRILIRPALSQADLGRQVASSRESVNRQLKIFAEQGLVEFSGDEIALLDVAGLEKMCRPAETG